MSELALENVHLWIRDKPLVREVSLSLAEGQFLALLGQNGAGKTSVLRLAIGLLRPSRGHVRINGRELRSLSPRARASEIAWLPQQTLIGEPLTALEVVQAARFRFDEARMQAERAAQAALERLGAGWLARARITELSGGERQRVQLAALLAQEARLLLLDEPASHLDPAQQLETYRLLGELWAEGLGILLVTHDVNLLGQLGASSRIGVLGLCEGQVAFRSTHAASDLPLRLSELFGVPFAALDYQGRRVLLPVTSPASTAARA